MELVPKLAGGDSLYQECGLAWASMIGQLGLGACVADDMGLGKTVQVLAFLLASRDGAQGDRSVDRARARVALLIVKIAMAPRGAASPSA